MLLLQNIHLKLGAFCLKDLSLHVNRGEYMVILGPTGTGKTVLLETVAGIHTVRDGKIFIHGQDVTWLPPEKRQIGIVFQDYALFPHMTVRKNITFGLGLKGKSKKKTEKAVRKIADFLDINDILDRRPGNLSGGEKQRVALARALALEPYILLLDEPLSALDHQTQDRLKYELKRIHQETGITIVHVTHDLTEAFFLADHMAVMKDGHILQQDTPSNIVKEPKSRTVARLVGIKNLIPSTMADNGRLHTRLGHIDLSDTYLKNISNSKKTYIMIPDWSIELFPDTDREAYAWKGKMKVTALNHMNETAEVVCSHASGEQITLRLSGREIRTLGSSLEIGAYMEIGIIKEGIHCIPAK